MQQNGHSLPDDSNHVVVRPLTVLRDQQNAAYCLRFSSDGTILASSGGETRFWYEDAQANWQLHHTTSGALLQINSDQTFLMVFTQEGVLDRVELQDNTGARLQTTSYRHMKQRYWYGYSPDQQWFLTYDDEGSLSFWEAQTLQF